MKTNAIRSAFLDYFKGQQHTVVPSSPLVPHNDPSLLFTNAGMVQFKNVFLGHEKLSFTKAASVQRCLRAGGKHNDLENVGYTARHHTFFEMLGNFSFGDYFKKEAIQYSWDFLTNVLQLPADRLWVTVYKDDQEAADIWLKHIKVDPKRFSYCGEKDNFWSMGDSGPCGPCSEIFYDHGADIPGGPPGSADEDADRYIEIWNLVFMQYNRDAQGNMTALPKPSVDTGMGLERLAAVMQGVHNNYDIDLFQHLIKATAKLANTKDITDHSLKVIADHIRACAFLITDGVIPSNEGRGYVLRRIIRRAIRHGHRLGLSEPFFYQLIPPLVDEMGAAYPELAKAQKNIEKALKQEEQQFLLTLDRGLNILTQWIKKNAKHSNVIPGDIIFDLYDTYGFPMDLTADVAREHNLAVDESGFAQAMEMRRKQSRKTSQFSSQYPTQLAVKGETIFTGYELMSDTSTIKQLLVDGKVTKTIHSDQQAIMVLAQTPFYAEAGGQAGDKGWIKTASAEFVVNDTQKQGEVILHIGQVTKGIFSENDEVTIEVDQQQRQATRLNHSATHLLGAAMQQVLGEHIQQKGSLVSANRLRFDFSHAQALTADELQAIEELVNDHIRVNHEVTTEVMPIEQAKKSGAVSLFGEKYGENVRVLTMGDFSKEFCGGTHVSRTGDIGLFKITQESSVASGVRRIEALTGAHAFKWVNEQTQAMQALSQLFNASSQAIAGKAQQLLKTNRKLSQQVEQLQTQLAGSSGGDLSQQAVDVHGINVLVTKLNGVQAKALRELCDQLKQKLKTAVIVLASVQGEHVSLIAGVTKDCTDKIKAGELVNVVATMVGGKGGGRPDMAQAGGTQPENIDKALAHGLEWIKTKLT